MRSVVVLPDPEGPSRTKNSPGAIVRSMPCSTVVTPCCLTTPSMRTLALPTRAGSGVALSGASSTSVSAKARGQRSPWLPSRSVLVVLIAALRL